MQFWEISKPMRRLNRKLKEFSEIIHYYYFNYLSAQRTVGNETCTGKSDGKKRSTRMRMLNCLNARHNATRRKTKLYLAFACDLCVCVLVGYFDSVLSLVTGQRFLHNLPWHRSDRLISYLLAVDDTAHRALNIQTLVWIHLLTYN